MTSPDKALALLLDLGSPTERWTRNELLDRALRTLQALMDADGVIVFTSTGGREERIALHGGSSVLAVLQSSSVGSEVIRALAEEHQPLLVPDLAGEPRFAETDSCPGVEAGPALFTPLRLKSVAPAYLAAYRKRGRARFGMHDVRAVVLLAAWLDAAIEKQRLASTRERLSMGGEGANVYRFRFLKDALDRELRRGIRFGHEVSIAKVQVDDLPPETGASVLGEVAAVLASQIRSFDMLGTCDRDSFLLVLPQTNRKGAVELAQRVREAVQTRDFETGPAGSVTLSAGVASFPRDGGDQKKLLEAAERALRKAKEQGKNSVATPSRRAA